VIFFPDNKGGGNMGSPIDSNSASGSWQVDKTPDIQKQALTGSMGGRAAVNATNHNTSQAKVIKNVSNKALTTPAETQGSVPEKHEISEFTSNDYAEKSEEFEREKEETFLEPQAGVRQSLTAGPVVNNQIKNEVIRPPVADSVQQAYVEKQLNDIEQILRLNQKQQANNNTVGSQPPEQGMNSTQINEGIGLPETGSINKQPIAAQNGDNRILDPKVGAQLDQFMGLGAGTGDLLSQPEAISIGQPKAATRSEAKDQLKAARSEAKENLKDAIREFKNEKDSPVGPVETVLLKFAKLKEAMQKYEDLKKTKAMGRISGLIGTMKHTVAAFFKHSTMDTAQREFDKSKKKLNTDQKGELASRDNRGVRGSEDRENFIKVLETRLKIKNQLIEFFSKHINLLFEEASMMDEEFQKDPLFICLSAGKEKEEGYWNGMINGCQSKKDLEWVKNYFAEGSFMKLELYKEAVKGKDVLTFNKSSPLLKAVLAEIEKAQENFPEIPKSPA
jgi:hypothetical protein